MSMGKAAQHPFGGEVSMKTTKTKKTNLRGLLAGVVGTSLLLGSVGTAAAAPGTKDYEGHWAQTTIQSWLASGQLKGFEDGSVKPNQTITRAEFMTLVNRAYHFTEIGKAAFSDVPAASWAYNEVLKAVAAGYIEGYNGQMRPNAPINRQEAAIMISKLMKLAAGNVEELKKFSDASKIAVWSQGSVAAVVKAGVLKGYPDGSFAPVQAMTRAESLTLIEAAVTAAPAASAEALPTPATSPAASQTLIPSPTPTATVATGGGGGGGISIPVTATPAPTVTPELPVKELPHLDISLTSRPGDSVTNTVYVEIDYSRVNGTVLKKFDNISYYVTSEPISSRDIRWELRNLPISDYSSGYAAQLQNPAGVSVRLRNTEGKGEQYFSVLVRNLDGVITGFYTQKIDAQPSVAVKDMSFVTLNSGVTITQEKFTSDKPVFSSINVYADLIDVTEAMAQFGGRAVAYTITPKYSMDFNTNMDLNDIINTSHRLYKYNQIRLPYGTTYLDILTPGDIPIAYESLFNEKTYNEGEYTIVFFDAGMKALGSYTGKVTLSDELKVEAAIKKIDDISFSVTLEHENAINSAARAFALLDETLRLQITSDRQTKLADALNKLEQLRKSGPLQNVDLVQSYIVEGHNQFNGKTIRVYTTGLPDELSEMVDKYSYYITPAPIRAEDLRTPSPYGKYDFANIDSAILPLTDKTGENYVTVVYYDKAGQEVGYTTRIVDFTPKLPVWDGTAVQVQSGVELVREYNNGSRNDYVSVKEYSRSHPEALYFTVTSRSALTADGKGFSAESAVQYLNDIGFTNSMYPYSQIQHVEDRALSGQPEDYIIIFYDANYKAIHYYIGGLSD